MVKSAPPVWVVIPTWNRWNELEECLRSVRQSAYPNLKVVVVDNGSTDDTVHHIQEKHPETVLIRLNENLGAAVASNAGFRLALAKGAEYILRLDSDIIVDRQLVSEFIRQAENLAGFGAFYAKVLRSDQADRIWNTGALAHPFLLVGKVNDRNRLDTANDRVPLERDYIPSAVMFLGRETLKVAGGFDETFFVYSEDFDLCKRIRDTGRKIYYIPTARAWHRIGSERLSARGARQFYRGRVLFYRKHARGLHRLLLVLFAAFLVFYQSLKTCQVSLIAPGLAGVVDGLQATLMHRVDL